MSKQGTQKPEATGTKPLVPPAKKHDEKECHEAHEHHEHHEHHDHGNDHAHDAQHTDVKKCEPKIADVHGTEHKEEKAKETVVKDPAHK